MKMYLTSSHRKTSKRCRLRVPTNARICASRVVECVPQYDEEITPIPVQPMANPAPAAEGSDDPVSPEVRKEMDKFLDEFSRPEPSS